MKSLLITSTLLLWSICCKSPVAGGSNVISRDNKDSHVLAPAPKAVTGHRTPAAPGWRLEHDPDMRGRSDIDYHCHTDPNRPAHRTDYGK